MCGPPPPSCAICNKNQGLLLCTACKIVHYCCRDHQIEHRPAHKEACDAIKRANKNFEIQESRLRLTEIDCATALSLPTYKFGKNLENARAAPFEALTAVETKASLEAQFEDMHRLFLLGPHTVPFARYYVQSLMLRLGKDQECYDLIVWFRSVIDTHPLDWASESQYGVTVKGADPLEAYRIAIGGQTELDLKINRALIKARLCIDWDTIKDMAAKGATKVSGESSTKIQPHVFESSIVANNPKIFDDKGEFFGGIMRVQTYMMLAFVTAENKHYWPALFAPDALTNRSKRFKVESFIDKSWASHSPELAKALVDLTIDAWLSTPKAFDFMREEYERMMRLEKEENIPLPHDPFSGRTADQLPLGLDAVTVSQNCPIM